MQNIGDATLTFLGDSSQLDQVFARIPAQTEAAMGTAAASVNRVGDAVGEVNFELDATAQNVPYCGDEIANAMDKAGSHARMGAAEIGLIGDLIGIILPKHVRTFLAELPGVGVALEAAFAATAVIFLLEALVKGAEKIQEWAEHGQKIADAWEKYDETIFTSSTHMQKEIDNQEKKLIEMTDGPVAGLDFALGHLAHTSEMVFKQITDTIKAAVDAMKEEEGSSQIFSPFGVQAEKDLEKFRGELAKTMREAEQANPNKPMAEYSAGIDLTVNKIIELQAKIESMKRAGADQTEMLRPIQTQIKALQEVNRELQKGVELQNMTDDAQKQSRADAFADQQAKQAKAALDAQIAAIDGWKAAQHAAYSEGKTDASDWKVAEVQAAQASTIAHETYLARLVSIYQRAGDAQKVQNAQQQLAKAQTEDLAKSTDKLAAAQRENWDQTAKAVGEYLKMQEMHVDKDFAAVSKAAEALTKAQEQLLKSETALSIAQGTNSVGYKDQEEAIKKLAAFRLITEEQKGKQLSLLYAKEESSALAALKDQLAKQQQIMQQAQAKLKASEGNPFFSDAQVLELRKNLALAQTEVNKTETQIATTRAQFAKQQLDLDKGRYGQALALAIATGNKELANQLKITHQALLLTEAKKAEAQARGLNTTAIDKEIAELQKQEIVLEKQTKQIGLMRQGWDAFSKDFRDQASRDKQVVDQLAQSLNTVAADLEQGFQDMFQGMIQGTETASQAIGKIMKKLVSDLAKQWSEFFFKKALADLFFNPALGAAELAAAVGLAALAGATADSGASSSGTGATSSSASTSSAASTQPGQQPVSVANVPKLFGGGIVTQPTYAMIGDRQGGGSQTEGVFPLGDPRARQALADAFGLGGGGVTHNYNIQGMVSTSDLTKLTRVISRSANTGRVRMNVTNSARVTRKS